MFACYRKGDANDPDTYVSAVGAVLADYTPDIIRDVTDPRTGLPSRKDWSPTVREVKSACEDIAGPRRRAAEWERRAQASLNQQALPPPAKLSRDEIEAILGRPLGDRTRPMKAFKGRDLEEFQAAHGITAEQWAALPNART